MSLCRCCSRGIFVAVAVVVAVYRNLLQCVAVCCRNLCRSRVAVAVAVVVAVSCSVLQGVAGCRRNFCCGRCGCCSVLQCVANVSQELRLQSHLLILVLTMT